ncbi:MAG: hypothetical protein ACE5Q6_13980, partial [Dehalococcoidia bacterium]
RIEEELQRGVSTKADVERILGKPNGSGAAFLEGVEVSSAAGEKRDIWLYEDPEGNVGEVYYKTGFNVKQGFGQPIDLENQTDEEILAFSKSCEETQGPFQGAKLPVGSAD